MRIKPIYCLHYTQLLCKELTEQLAASRETESSVDDHEERDIHIYYNFVGYNRSISRHSLFEVD